MAGIAHLEQEKARALQEAIQTAVELLGEETPRRQSALHDVTARSMAGFEAVMLAAELTRVVAAQEARVAVLERRIMALSKKTASEATGNAEPTK